MVKKDYNNYKKQDYKPRADRNYHTNPHKNYHQNPSDNNIPYYMKTNTRDRKDEKKNRKSHHIKRVQGKSKGSWKVNKSTR